MWLLVAIVGRFILGSSAIIDKLFLKKSYSNPIGYAFWSGILGLAALILIPSGFQFIPGLQIVIGLLAGISLMIGTVCMFSALFRSEASSSLIFIGAVSPVFTLLFSAPLVGETLFLSQAAGFALLIAGGLVLYIVEIEEEKKLKLKIIALVSASSLFLGLSNALTKVVFLGANFVTGFIWIKIGGVLLSLSLLLIPKIRRQITKPSEEKRFKNPITYILNRGYAGIGSLLVAYAILLGSVSLVDATLNIQYALVMLGAWLVLKEKFHGKILFAKILSLILVSLGLLWISTGNYLNSSALRADRPITWGVSFSEKFSMMLGLDWKKNYQAVLNDLKPKNLRLMAYWDMIEKENNKYDFADTDYEMKLAEKSGTKIILAIGQKVPRWPECHYPTWTRALSADDRNSELLDYMKEVVLRYKSSSALLYWQVENEPFLTFGECLTVDKNFFDKELSLVRNSDGDHKIITTDSGELSLWYQTAERGDIFGISIYRRVYNKIFGQIEYYLPPEFCRVKENLTRFITKH